MNGNDNKNDGEIGRILIRTRKEKCSWIWIRRCIRFLCLINKHLCCWINPIMVNILIPAPNVITKIENCPILAYFLIFWNKYLQFLSNPLIFIHLDQ
jgi:hypothetical protein